MGKQLAITNNGAHLVGKKLYLTAGGVHRKAVKAYLTAPNFIRRALPSGYTQVEYIKSSGTQYIDTGFTPDNNSRMVIDFAATDVSAVNSIAGSRNTTTAQAFTFGTTAGGNWRLGYNTSTVSAGVAADTERHTADLNKNVLSLDGTVIYTATAATFTGYASIYICAIHASATGYWGYAKIYSCQIYDNGTLVRDFVPCINASGTVGLYDMVNAAFYTDAAGGTFTAGAPYTLIHHLCYKGSADVAALGITYSASGGMTDTGIVTMGDGKQYRLLTITKSGTLTVDEEVSAEVWMCGGGTSGRYSYGVRAAGGGGAGAFTATGKITLSGSKSAVIGSGGTGTMSSPYYSFGGASSFGDLTTPTNFSANAYGGCGISGGTGGGSSYTETVGSGDGISKYPFADTTYFTKPHCAGGGAGAYTNDDDDRKGGDGGTNGGSGGYSTSSSWSPGAGGNYGGGKGGSGAGSNGYAATFYGSAGGGGAFANNSRSQGGAGYQGIIYIRIPVEQ